jgi:pimeloyl-ACP methyl ester carboxylesterase
LRRDYRAADGTVLAADVEGPQIARTVVLMHGGGQTRNSWASSMQALLAAGYRVINYDARGHGESGWSPDGVYSFPIRAADLKDVLVDTPGPFALIGASMGGVTALQAIGEGVAPRALVLVDIVLRPAPRGVQRIREFMLGNPEGFSDLEEAAMAVAAYNPMRRRPLDPAGLMRNLRRGTDGRLHWHWDPRILPANMGQDLGAMERVITHLPKVRGIPTLLIRGMQSDMLSEASVTEFRRSLPHAELLDVADAGHMVVGDSNEIFARGVLDFLSAHCPP